MIWLGIYLFIGVVVLLLLYKYTDFMYGTGPSDLFPVWGGVILFWPIVLFLVVIHPLAEKLHEKLLKIRKKQ